MLRICFISANYGAVGLSNIFQYILQDSLLVCGELWVSSSFPKTYSNSYTLWKNYFTPFISLSPDYLPVKYFFLKLITFLKLQILNILRMYFLNYNTGFIQETWLNCFAIICYIICLAFSIVYFNCPKYNFLDLKKKEYSQFLQTENNANSKEWFSKMKSRPLSENHCMKSKTRVWL